MFSKLTARRGVLLALAVVAAVLNAKGVQTYGFFDGPG
jgi:hypothetical protein